MRTWQVLSNGGVIQDLIARADVTIKTLTLSKNVSHNVKSVIFQYGLCNILMVLIHTCVDRHFRP